MTEGAATAICTWKKAFQDLRISLDAFVSVTDTLCDSKRQDDGRISISGLEHVAEEDVYSKVSEYYAELDGFEGKFGLARAKIQNIRNQSHSIVPVHRLPDEILSTVFVLGSQDRIQAVGLDAEVAIEHAATAREDDVADADSDESEDSDSDEDEGDEVHEGDGTGAGAESDEEHETRDDSASPEATKGKPQPFNLLVSQVCHRWREVALNTGQLWTRIDLTEPLPHERMKLWLERSKNYPLHVCLDTHPPATNSESLILAFLVALEHLKSSIPQSAEPRCVNLTINTRQPCKDVRLVLLELSLYHPSIRLQSLKVDEHLLMCCSTHARYWKSISLSEMLRGVTALHLHAFYFPWGHPAYSNLVELTISDVEDEHAPTAAQFETILRGCPLLEYFALDSTDIAPNVHPQAAPSPIIMRSLHTITVRHLQFAAFAFVFSTIRAPCLRQLDFHGMHYDNEFDNRTKFRVVISGFFASAGRSLRYLSISDEEQTIRCRSLISFLRKAPCVTSLKFEDISKLQPIVWALTHEAICPELQSLTVAGCEDERGIAISLLSLVTNRKHTRPIQYLAAPAKVLKGSALTLIQDHVPHLEDINNVSRDDVYQ
ncbi:hypothetical protein BOTBODRAFT_179962 [Botryobasidium botryosum FD-172 SS1]|uniref:Uncharacterized protein n=1 Tax=Botryobasidium botryosum (strain FD-172 SS1) TaxID=930990 RepID=A0A067M933_BOTB1|nr:hypothetical protein BOTBODRAFT_179962 [Botryobasidium botryosum FD-172 SS1]